MVVSVETVCGSCDCFSTDPDSFDACAGDLLAVVELDAFQTLATLEVLQCDVCDQGAVVQLHDLQTLLTTHTAAQMSDSIICYQLTV